MTSIERTAFPLLRRLPTARELHVFYTPTSSEVVWAREKTRSDDHLLALILALKCFQRLARFPRVAELSDPVVEHVRRCLEIDAPVSAAYGADRTERAHRDLVRARVGVNHDPPIRGSLIAGGARELPATESHRTRAEDLRRVREADCGVQRSYRRADEAIVRRLPPAIVQLSRPLSNLCPSIVGFVHLQPPPTP